MSAAQPAPPTQSGPAPAPRVVSPAPIIGTDRPRMLRARPSEGRGPRTTPELLRAMSVGIAVLAVAFGVVAFVAARGTSATTISIRDNDGPVLVSLQTLGASLAEADAAATAAFLSGEDEDPRARSAYLAALDRSVATVESIASLLENDDLDAHTDLARTAQAVTTYAANVEAARTAVIAGLPDSDDRLLTAIDQLDTRVTSARLDVAARATASFNDAEATQSSVLRPIAVVIGLLLLAALVGAQLWLTRRTRRLLNPPLVLATVAALAGVVWFGLATGAAVDRTATARSEAFDGIQNTAELQRQGLAARSASTVAAITGNPEAVSRARDAETLVAGPLGQVDPDGQSEGLIADTVRAAPPGDERALAVEIAQRWNRFEAAAREPGTSSLDDVVASADSFNGFNFAVEGLLGEYRDQFQELLDDAASRVSLLPFGVLGVAILAALLALIGFQLRLAEYR